MSSLFPELYTLKLAVALPSYNGARYNAVPLMHLARQVPQAIPLPTQSSLLALTFNLTLANALRLAKEGKATHYLMLHDDICPLDSNWFDQMWAAWKDSNAELMCAVSPIKDERGLTSVAIESEDPWKPRRLTMKEVAAGPVTFTHPRLLLNTGCMMFDLRAPWVKDCWFKIDDGMTWTDDGIPTPRVMPEDWQFSRMARAAGCERIYATRAVRLDHVGQQRFPNYSTWGLEHDDGT